MVDLNNQPLEIPATISETIYKYLKKAILEGELKPGQRLQEKEIAGLYHMSTTPVREAFRRLAAEKFLTIDARKGVVVTPVSMEDIRDLFEVLIILDVYAAKRALPAISPGALEQLKHMTLKMGESYRKKQLVSYIRENLEIHFKIWEECGNRFLRQTLRDSGERFAFYSHQFFLLIPEPDAYLEKSFQEHLDLIEALENKDQAKIERTLTSHWGTGYLGEHNGEGR
jgi:DNA-binding GntR family transcriptional regulator